MQLKLSSPKVWVCFEAVDFRKSIDGLTEIALGFEDGNVRADVFVFYNRARDKVKVLAWHGNGFILLYKRLEQGKFSLSTAQAGYATIDEKQLSWLLAGLDWEKMSAWDTLEYDNYF